MSFLYDLAFLIAVSFLSYLAAPFFYKNFSSWPAGKTLRESMVGSLFCIGFGVLWNFVWERPTPIISFYQDFDGSDLFWGYLFSAIIVAMCVIEVRARTLSDSDGR